MKMRFFSDLKFVIAYSRCHELIYWLYSGLFYPLLKKIVLIAIKELFIFIYERICDYSSRQYGLVLSSILDYMQRHVSLQTSKIALQNLQMKVSATSFWAS